MLEVDAATSAILERAYRGADFRNRRKASFKALAPAPGERLADIGCGNGLPTRELALSVGPSGHVTESTLAPRCGLWPLIGRPTSTMWISSTAAPMCSRSRIMRLTVLCPSRCSNISPIP